MQSQKFLSFWGWKSLPWNEPMPLAAMFWQEASEQLCSRLLFSLSRTASLFAVVAPPGHGKSTLARWLYQHIDVQTHDVALFSLLHHELKGDWLLPRLHHYLSGEKDEHSARSVLQKLHDSRLHRKTLTIIIDDAHKLASPEAFDEILSLTQLQSLVASRINFVLLGNPKLLQNLQAIESAQHRLALWGQLQLLKASELGAFFSRRLEQLHLPPQTLQAEALAVISQFGVGTFAALESILEICLVEAFLRDQRSINADVMTTAIQFFNSQKLSEEPSQDKMKAASKRHLQASPLSKQAVAPGSAARDLNSLYYKSDGGHDPEQS